MNSRSVDGASRAEASGRRGDLVLQVALETFARFGYRKTSMEDVARAAGVSRPGLYLRYRSKEELFRAAVTRSLESDLAHVEKILATEDRSLQDRLADAFDTWSGQYVGPLAQDVTTLIGSQPDVLGDISTIYPTRFADLLTRVLTIALDSPDTELITALSRTLQSVATGIKHEASSREEFRQRMTTAVQLLALSRRSH